MILISCNNFTWYFSIFNYAKVRKRFKASEYTEQLNYATIQ